MKRLLIFIIPAFIIACGGENPVSDYETSDEEAIYNVVILDNVRLSEIVAFPDSVPDTLAFIANPDPDQPIHWHVVDSTVERMPINYSYDQPSPVGLVDQANANYSKKWYGFFNTITYNSDADSIERYTKEFEITGSRTAICQRWGNTNQRRGWLLTAISAATISAGGGLTFLQDLHFDSPSNDDSTFSRLIVSVEDLLRFDTEEQVTLNYELVSQTDLPYIFVPEDNFGYRLAEPVQVGDGFEIDVIMPDRERIYGQFRFYVINAGDFEDDYRGSGYAYNYWMR